MMLPLDDPRWAELRHAYGPASDIPELLRQLRSFPPEDAHDAEPYYSLWSALCHQDDVYPASYAAVPHIVEMLLAAPEKAHWSAVQLVVCIEISRARGRGLAMPAALRAAYDAALPRLADFVRQIASARWDEGVSRVMLAALATSKGHVTLAEGILELEPEVLGEFLQWVAER
jgi:hypothetical protein